MAFRRIGQIFVDLGFITDDQLEMLVEEQAQHPGQLLGRIAIDMGLVEEDQLVSALSEQFRMKTFDLEGLVLKPEVKELVTDAMAQMYRVIPLKLEGNQLTLATCDPHNLSIRDELRRFLGYEISLVISTETQIKKTLDKYFNEDIESMDKIIAELNSDEDLKKAVDELSGGGPINLTDVN